MPDASIKFRKNGTRGNITPGECINLDGPLSPGGVKGLKFGTNMQGGDGSIEFNIGYRKHSPAKKNDGVEVYYGLGRVTQHAIMDVQPDEMNGALHFSGQGHGAHMEKTVLLIWTTGNQNALTAQRMAIWDATDTSAIKQGFPFLNASQRYFLTTGMIDSLVTNYSTNYAATLETVLSDMGKHNDQIRGMFPGREAHPDGLGCFYYRRHRTSGQTPKWFISQEDLRLGNFGVTKDLSEHCNSVYVLFTQTSDGLVHGTLRENTADKAIYTPGSSEKIKLDLTSNGTMTLAVANQIGDAFLEIYSNPVLKGTITLPLQNLRRTGGGSQWAGFIRGGDIVRVERDYGGYSDILIDTTMVDVDAGTIELGMPNANTLETILAGQLAA